jgi:hypothetical protein
MPTLAVFQLYRRGVIFHHYHGENKFFMRSAKVGIKHQSINHANLALNNNHSLTHSFLGRPVAKQKQIKQTINK